MKTKRILAAVLVLVSVFSVSCGQKEQKNVTFEELKTAVAANVEDSASFASRDDNYPFGFFQTKPEDFTNCVIMQHTSGDLIDEYGIFEAKEETGTDTAESFVKEYLDFYKNTLWDSRYKQDQYPKLENAQYRVYGGKYVVYTIMDTDASEKVFTALDTLFGE